MGKNTRSTSRGWFHKEVTKYKSRIKDINLDGLLGIDNISFDQSPTFIAGLNGTGKSTIISSLKSVIGLKLNNSDLIRIEGHAISATIIIDGIEYKCSNHEGNRLFDIYEDKEKIVYIDALQSTKIQELLLDDVNFVQDIPDQYEKNNLDIKELEEINLLVGKDYSELAYWNIEDYDIPTFPYIRVTEGSKTYDNRTMGTGEHFILYLFWMLKNLSQHSMLIIEEPETYISVRSQQNLLSLLARKVKEGYYFIIMSTHSPFILQHECIYSENVMIATHMNNKTNIKPSPSTADYKSLLGLPNISNGTLLVEDEVGKIFLECILKDKAGDILRNYHIAKVNGYTEITDTLLKTQSISPAYKFIGVYDGDVRHEIENDAKISERSNIDFVFLPGDIGLEGEIKDCFKEQEFVDEFEKFFNKDINIALSKIQGSEDHDWFNKLALETTIGKEEIIKFFYEKKYKNHECTQQLVDKIRESKKGIDRYLSYINYS